MRGTPLFQSALDLVFRPVSRATVGMVQDEDIVESHRDVKRQDSVQSRVWMTSNGAEDDDPIRRLQLEDGLGVHTGIRAADDGGVGC